MLGLLFVVVLVVGAWFMPWRAVAAAIGGVLDDQGNNAPAWVVADGSRYNIALFPELFGVLGNRYGGDGKKTFAVPRIRGIDYLSDNRFGSRVVDRCLAARRLDDNTPAGTLAWCTPQGRM
jgi:hypothetical protein